MALTEADRRLLERCLQHEPEAWNEFVDRFLGVVYHVVHHTSQMRQLQLGSADVDDISAEVMAQIVHDDFRILRHFRGKASLATYLTVVARRVVVRELARRRDLPKTDGAGRIEAVSDEPAPDEKIETEEEVHRLLETLTGREAELVRGFYLEHKSYQQLSQEMGIPENTIGPLLSRLRGKLRKAAPKS